MKRGFTIIELLVTIVVTSILFTMLATAYVNYDEINKQAISNQKFTLTYKKLKNMMDENDRLMSTIISPEGILKINGYTTDDFIYRNTIQTSGNMSDNYNDYLLIREDREDISQLQMDFFDISQYDGGVSGGSRYLLFITSREGITSDGFKFPYKILTLVDLGNTLYRGWKRTMLSGNTTEAKNFLRLILKPVNHGYIKNLVIDRDEDVVQNIMKKITGSQDVKYAFEIWDSNKYDVKVMNISTYKNIRERVENSITNMKKIVKNIEDWALIQARIAAYNTLNGDNLDKDYFITCSDDDSCHTGYVPVDRDRTLMTEIVEPLNELEKSTSNGFIVCPAANDGTCSGTKTYVINDSCVDNVIYRDEPIITVEQALPIDRTANDGDNYKLGNAVQKSLLSITKQSENDFGFPIYFTNSDKFIVTNNSDFFINNGDVDYREELNIPIKDQPSNPPYVAKLFTIFPFYIGGHYADDGTGNRVLTFNDGWGIYSITIFAHVF